MKKEMNVQDKKIIIIVIDPNKKLNVYTHFICDNPRVSEVINHFGPNSRMF